MPTRPEVVAQLVASGLYEVVPDDSAGYPQKV